MSPPTIVAPGGGEQRRGGLADAASDAGEHGHPVREIEQLLYAGHRHSSRSDGSFGREPTDRPEWPMTALLALGSRISDVNVLAYLAAFGGGVVSFLSPCVLPLVPGYLSMVTGLDIATLEDDALEPRAPHRRAPPALFIAGFGTVFVLLGLTAASIGQPLRDHQVIAHAHLGRNHAGDGAVPPRIDVPARAVALPGEAIPSAARPLRRGRAARSRARRSGSAGRRASARSSVRSSASRRSQQRVWAGASLLAVYSIGLGLPFLVTGLALEPRRPARSAGSSGTSRRSSSARRSCSARFGILLMFDELSRLSGDFQRALDERAPRMDREPRMSIPDHTAAALEPLDADLARAPAFRARGRLVEDGAAPQLDHRRLAAREQRRALVAPGADGAGAGAAQRRADRRRAGRRDAARARPGGDRRGRHVRVRHRGAGGRRRSSSSAPPTGCSR